MDLQAQDRAHRIGQTQEVFILLEKLFHQLET